MTTYLRKLLPREEFPTSPEAKTPKCLRCRKSASTRALYKVMGPMTAAYLSCWNCFRLERQYRKMQ